MDVKIEQSWKDALADEFGKPYFVSLVRFLHEEKAAGKRIFPPGNQIFRAFDLTPLDKVKVVILGQDPYHGAGQAHGLSFSVPDGVPAPPSLKNIFKEIETDLGIRMSGYPNLEKWARQGVLMLNAVLTVRSGEAASHSKAGWEQFTDAVIKCISTVPKVLFSCFGEALPAARGNWLTRHGIMCLRRRILLRWRGEHSSDAGIFHVQTRYCRRRARSL